MHADSPPTPRHHAARPPGRTSGPGSRPPAQRRRPHTTHADPHGCVAATHAGPPASLRVCSDAGEEKRRRCGYATTCGHCSGRTCWDRVGTSAQPWVWYACSSVASALPSRGICLTRIPQPWGKAPSLLLSCRALSTGAAFVLPWSLRAPGRIDILFRTARHTYSRCVVASLGCFSHSSCHSGRVTHGISSTERTPRHPSRLPIPPV